MFTGSSKPHRGCGHGCGMGVGGNWVPAGFGVGGGCTHDPGPLDPVQKPGTWKENLLCTLLRAGLVDPASSHTPAETWEVFSIFHGRQLRLSQGCQGPSLWIRGLGSASGMALSSKLPPCHFSYPHRAGSTQLRNTASRSMCPGLLALLWKGHELCRLDLNFKSSCCVTLSKSLSLSEHQMA